MVVFRPLDGAINLLKLISKATLRSCLSMSYVGLEINIAPAHNMILSCCLHRNKITSNSFPASSPKLVSNIVELSFYPYY